MITQITKKISKDNELKSWVPTLWGEKNPTEGASLMLGNRGFAHIISHKNTLLGHMINSL